MAVTQMLFIVKFFSSYYGGEWMVRTPACTYVRMHVCNIGKVHVSTSAKTNPKNLADFT